MKWIKWGAVTLGVLFVLVQLVRPARTNPPTDPSKTIYAAIKVPADVAAILKRACADCHSHDTKWPWYSNVAPMSWLVADHVNHGRRHLNLSDWTQGGRKAAPEDALDRLEAMCEEVKSGEMPLSSYLLLHRDARLTDADRTAMCAWTKTERAR